uniref:Uncharacterized protein n=1 Tax=Oryza sativa subsp. japonica TaxID=39947 RepID=Q6K480_ORYSJ|nr:hypothetical protein [Oryza sativa Japonica Group]
MPIDPCLCRPHHRMPASLSHLIVSFFPSRAMLSGTNLHRCGALIKFRGPGEVGDGGCFVPVLRFGARVRGESAGGNGSRPIDIPR